MKNSNSESETINEVSMRNNNSLLEISPSHPSVKTIDCRDFSDDSSDNSDNENESASECNSDSENKKYLKSNKTQIKDCYIENGSEDSSCFGNSTSLSTTFHPATQSNSTISNNVCNSTDSTYRINSTPRITLANKTNLNNILQFSRSSVGGSKYLMNAHLNISPNGDDLMFESRFESGNLAKVIKITPVYYELYLRADLYTNRHTQWFYFRVTNTRKNISYR